MIILSGIFIQFLVILISLGIFGYTPHKVHFCTHASSIVVRKLLSQNCERQLQSKKIYQRLANWQKIEVGDFVRVKNLKKIIQKESSVFYPGATTEIYKIRLIDKAQWPYLFSLEGYPNKEKKFYGWQLIKVKSAKSNLPLDQTHFKADDSNHIKVVNVTVTNSKQLRSKKPFSNKVEVTYEIQREGKTEFVTGEDLKLYQKLFGKKVLSYSPEFDKPPKKDFVI